MKVAIFGSGGLLGSYCNKILGKDHEILRVSRSSNADYNLDAGDVKKVMELLEKEKPDVVINCIKSNLSTDQAEIQQQETWNSNVTVPQNLATLQKKFGYHLIHISSDWVYEGKNGVLYGEDSITYPQNFYSYTKIIAEERIKTAENYLILRPTGIFGIDSKGTNFFSRVKSSVESKKEINAPSDQFSQPIYAGELARIIKIALEKKSKGIYNAVGHDYVSRYELAVMFCEVFDWDKSLIKSIKSSQRSIRVPQYLHLDISKLEREITEVKTLKDQILDVKKDNP